MGPTMTVGVADGGGREGVGVGGRVGVCECVAVAVTVGVGVCRSVIVGLGWGVGGSAVDVGDAVNGVRLGVGVAVWSGGTAVGDEVRVGAGAGPPPPPPHAWHASHKATSTARLALP